MFFACIFQEDEEFCFSLTKMPAKRNLPDFEKVIPKAFRISETESIVRRGRFVYPVVYPETTLICGRCGKGPLTFGSMSKHMNPFGEGCKGAPTKVTVQPVKVIKEKVCEKENTNTSNQAKEIPALPSKVHAKLGVPPRKKAKPSNKSKLNQAQPKIKIRKNCDICRQMFRLKGLNFKPCFSCKNNTSED